MSQGAVMPVRSPAGADTGDARINFAAHQVRANAQGARQDFEEMIGQLVTAVRPGVACVVAAKVSALRRHDDHCFPIPGLSTAN